MFTKKNVITAKFINEEHTVIEVLTNIKDTVHSYALEYDKDSADFKALEKAGWDLERVTEETVAYKRDTSRIYDESIAAAAQQWLEANPPEEVVIERIENIKVDDIIGALMSKNEDEDSLFRAKLAVMELPAAKASKSTKVKQDIRKAKSLIELISNISKL